MARKHLLVALCAAAPLAAGCGATDFSAGAQQLDAAPDAAQPEVPQAATGQQNSATLDPNQQDAEAARLLASNQSSLLASYTEGASATSVVHPAGYDDLCLDVVWGNNKNGVPVQVSKCNGNQAQQWSWSNGMLRAYGDKCLNVTEGADENGTRLQIWTCSGETSSDKNNLWQMQGNTLRWQGNTERCLDVMNGKFASGTPLQLWSCGGSKGNANQRWTLANAGQAPAGNPAAPSGGSNAGTNAPASNLKSTTPNFEVGVHVDYDNASGQSGGANGFVSRTQLRPRLLANYVRCKKDGSFETGTAKHYADEAAAVGAKIISYAITVEPVTLSKTQLDAIAEVTRYARSKQLAVELRFGYEMNGFWSPPLYDNNNPEVYKKAWAQLAPVARAAGAAMVWCPNVAGGAPDVYRAWLPWDLTSIDKAGLDYYLNSAQGQKPTVAQARNIIAGFNPVVQQINDAHRKAGTGREVPWTFGETAVTIRDDRANWGKSVAYETELKRQWLVAISDAGLRREFPLYRGFTWFDYYKTEKEGGTRGNTYHNSFEFSQDPGSAAMLRSWYQSMNIQ